MEEWAGLGYYARARHLHAAAKALLARGGFPAEVAELAAIPGIGPYTAAAVAAIAFGQPVVPVDANVQRITARLFAIDRPLPAARGEIAAAAQRWMAESGGARPAGGCGAGAVRPRRPGVHPRAPACPLCPAAAGLQPQRAPGRPDAFPAKAAEAAASARRHGGAFPGAAPAPTGRCGSAGGRPRGCSAACGRFRHPLARDGSGQRPEARSPTRRCRRRGGRCRGWHGTASAISRLRARLYVADGPCPARRRLARSRAGGCHPAAGDAAACLPLPPPPGWSILPPIHHLAAETTRMNRPRRRNASPHRPALLGAGPDRVGRPCCLGAGDGADVAGAGDDADRGGAAARCPGRAAVRCRRGRALSRRRGAGPAGVRQRRGRHRPSVRPDGRLSCSVSLSPPGWRATPAPAGCGRRWC